MDSQVGYSHGDGQLVDVDRVASRTGVSLVYTILDVRLCHLIVHSRWECGPMFSILYVGELDVDIQRYTPLAERIYHQKRL